MSVPCSKELSITIQNQYQYRYPLSIKNQNNHIHICFDSLLIFPDAFTVEKEDLSNDEWDTLLQIENP